MSVPTALSSGTAPTSTIAPGNGTPLSNGQLYSWRELSSYPPDGLAEANLPATVDLRGRSVDTVRRALDRLVAHHEVLRTTYALAGDLPRQDVDTDVAPPVTWLDRPVAGREDPERTTAALLQQAQPMTGALPWRGSVVTTAGAPMFASFSLSHTVVDLWSVRELQRQLEALLRDPAVELPVAPSPRALAAREQDAAGQRRQAAAERYWDGVLAAGGASLPTPPPGRRVARIQATLHSHRLSGLAGEAARRLASTAPAVVAAVLGAALADLLGRDRVVVDLMSSNRFRPELRGVVGTMNQLVPVAVAAEPAATLQAHVAATTWAAATAYRHSGYDVDRILARSGTTFTEAFPVWFNYLPLDDEVGDGRDRRPAELVWTPRARPFGQPVDVRVTACGGRLSVALRTDPALVPGDALIGLLRTVARGVHVAATAPGTSCRDLVRATVPLDPALFPSASLVPPPPEG